MEYSHSKFSVAIPIYLVKVVENFRRCQESFYTPVLKYPCYNNKYISELFYLLLILFILYTAKQPCILNIVYIFLTINGLVIVSAENNSKTFLHFSPLLLYSKDSSPT